MEWYYVVWKEKMYDVGLKTYRKLLPDNSIFKHCVKNGKEKIFHDFPNGKFKLIDIKYASSIEDAVLN